jgi:peptide/nickel transport system permease protein
LKKLRKYWHAYHRNSPALRFAWLSLGILLFVFVFADFIANDKPIFAIRDGKPSMPVLKAYLVKTNLTNWDSGFVHVDWSKLEYDFVIWPVIPYNPYLQDVDNPGVGPGKKQKVNSLHRRHWLGTDELGRDVLAAMIHSTRIDLFIGIAAMFIASIIGILLGGLAGFFGDDRMKISRGALFTGIPVLFFCWFYGIYVRWYEISDAFQAGFWSTATQFLITMGLFLFSFALGYLANRFLKRFSFFNHKLDFQWDMAISRFIEVFISIPVLFLIIMILSLTTKGSVFWIMVIIGLTRWTGIARLIRAEILKIKNLNYVESATALGYSNLRILLRHVIPNAMGPVIISISFGIASVILIEAFLSFIGIGLPPDIPTWGSMLNMGRQNPTDWWMALFPGLAIFITVLTFNLLGDGLSKR